MPEGISDRFETRKLRITLIINHVRRCSAACGTVQNIFQALTESASRSPFRSLFFFLSKHFNGEIISIPLHQNIFTTYVQPPSSHT